MENPEGNTRNTKSTSNKVKKLWPLAVVIVIVVGFLVASHSKPATTVSHVNGVGVTQTYRTTPYPIGKIGSTFTVGLEGGYSAKVKLVQIIKPFTAGVTSSNQPYNTVAGSDIAAEFEVTNTTSQSLPWEQLSSQMDINTGEAPGGWSGGYQQVQQTGFLCTNGVQPPIDPIPSGVTETGCFSYAFANGTPDKIVSIGVIDTQSTPSDGFPNGRPVAVWRVD